ncbi:MAG: asparaginase domain-containing protein [Candidatus Microsaccharimonas sp.]
MHFITTGGTLDKLPVRLDDGSFDNDSKLFGDTHIPEMLEKMRFTLPYTLDRLCTLDSLDMTDEDRAKIVASITSADDERVVITHGTDTMPETARFILNRPRKEMSRRTIILTGAMEPYSMGASSDAMANLGTAIAYAQTSPAGVYVAMNGQAFNGNRVLKDKQAGVFYEA